MLVFHNRQEVPQSDAYEFIAAESLKYATGRMRRDGTEAINSALTIRYAELDGEGGVKAYVNLSLAQVYPEVGNRHARGILLFTEADHFEGRISKETWLALKSYAKYCATAEVQGNGGSKSLVLAAGNMQYHLTIEFPENSWFGVEIEYIQDTGREVAGYSDSYQIIEFALDGIEVSAPITQRDAIGVSKVNPFGDESKAVSRPTALAKAPVQIARPTIPAALRR
jgi:hypothetical protein